jgi:hypothetical protein
MCREPFGEIRLGAERPHHGGLVHTGDERALQRPRGRNAPRTSGQTTFADKISRLEECDDRFLALRGDDRNLDPAFSDVEDGIRRVTLGEDGLTLGVSGYGESTVSPPSALARNASRSNLDFAFLATTEILLGADAATVGNVRLSHIFGLGTLADRLQNLCSKLLTWPATNELATALL